MKKNHGFSIVEMMVAVSLFGVMAVIVSKSFDFSRKETTELADDIMNIISKYGASRILTQDLLSAELSFNYIHMADDENLPFFVYSKNEFCQHEKCNRQLTLEIPEGKLRSKSIYLIVKRSRGQESLKFNIDPNMVFSAKNVYAGVNKDVSNPDLSISKSSTRVDSPWTKGRFVMVKSEIEIYDCMMTVNSMRGLESCRVSCDTPGKCNYIVKRPLKLLGTVNSDEIDMTYKPILGEETIFRTPYKVCRPNKDLYCESTIDISSGINSSKKFFENLPYIPGSDNNVSISPVEVVEYYLERPNTNSPDQKIVLKRAIGKDTGKGIRFDTPLILMTGLKSIIFLRTNVSNPIIEYKLRKVRMKGT